MVDGPYMFKVRRTTRTLFSVATILSLLLCAASLGLLAVNHRSGLRDTRFLSLGGGVRATVWERGLSIYNTEFPYSGSIIDVTSSANPRGSRVSQRVIDFPVYYRHFRWPTHSVWVLTVPLPLVMLLTLALPLGWVWGKRRTRGGGRRGYCAACGYDLRATPARCPECGTIPPR